jgi:hypothetical protein
VIRRTSHALIVIECDLNDLGPHARFSWRENPFDADVAVGQDRVAEVFLSSFGFLDQLFERELAAIRKRHLCVARETAAGRIPLNDKDLAFSRIAAAAVC